MTTESKPRDTRKRKRSVVIVCIVVLAFGMVGLAIFSNWVDGERMKARCEEITLYLRKYDEEFEQKYGKVVSVALNSDQKWKSVGKNEFLIPCIVTVEGGSRYFVWVDYYSDSFATTVQYDRIEQIVP